MKDQLSRADLEKAPSRQELEQQLYAEIRRAIAERRLLPGVKLTEEALAELFLVSRARVRKVLLLLAKDHIVTHEPNRGAFVWRPSVVEAMNVLESRKVIELHLIKQAAKQATRKQIKELRKILKAESVALNTHDRAATMRLSGEFHIAMAECAGNPILTDFLAGLVSRCYLILATYQRQNTRSCPQTDHCELVDRIEAGDGEGAAQLLELHFLHIEAELDLDDNDDKTTNLREILKHPR